VQAPGGPDCPAGTVRHGPACAGASAPGLVEGAQAPDRAVSQSAPRCVRPDWRTVRGRRSEATLRPRHISQTKRCMSFVASQAGRDRSVPSRRRRVNQHRAVRCTLPDELFCRHLSREETAENRRDAALPPDPCRRGRLRDRGGGEPARQNRQAGPGPRSSSQIRRSGRTKPGVPIPVTDRPFTARPEGAARRRCQQTPGERPLPGGRLQLWWAVTGSNR